MSSSEAQEKAVDLYRRLLLPDPEQIGYRYPHQVSGGQLQRAMVAMAMSCQPDIIVFDEPTTALDVTTQIEVLAAIKEITQQFNTAAIYITHDLAVVAQLADRIMVLRNGDLVEENNTRELLAHPQGLHPPTAVGTLFAQTRSPRFRGRDRTSGRRRGFRQLHGRQMVLENINLKIDAGPHRGSGGRIRQRQEHPGPGDHWTAAAPGRPILFRGEELPPKLKSRERETLRCMQMIYQMPDTALNPRQKVAKILGRPLDFYFGLPAAESDRRIRELLEMTGLPADTANAIRLSSPGVKNSGSALPGPWRRNRR